MTLQEKVVCLLTLDGSKGGERAGGSSQSDNPGSPWPAYYNPHVVSISLCPPVRPDPHGPEDRLRPPLDSPVETVLVERVAVPPDQGEGYQGTLYGDNIQCTMVF